MIVVTGFKPWGRHKHNPSEELAKLLHGRVIAGQRVESKILPVSYRAALEAVAEIHAISPRLTLHLGLAASAPALRMEKVAVNIADAGPDVEGVEKRGEPVVPGGPAAYFATAPMEEMVDASRRAGVPARLSYTAGTYLCNYIFYLSLHHAGRGAAVGFIHLPLTPEMALEGNAPFIPLELQLRGVLAAVEAALKVLR